MFTGLIFETGRVAEPVAQLGEAGKRLVLEHSRALGQRLERGASLAVAGVCLTVVPAAPTRAWVELSPETLGRTRLGTLLPGARVNLEPALRASDPLGGHFVTGHVDGLVEILERRQLGSFVDLRVALPLKLAPFVAEKGSVALDGVSLTVAWIEQEAFVVSLIPETLARTTLGEVQPGQSLHFEADLLARYAARLLEPGGRLR